MAKRLQHRGGTTSQHSTFTGAVREVTVDTDKNTLVVHDGATAGGKPLPTLTGAETLSNKTLASPTFSGTATNFTSTGIDDNTTSTAITIDSSGDVGIGTSSIQNQASGRSVLQLENSSNNLLNFYVSGSRAGYLYSSLSTTNLFSVPNVPLTFGTNNTERMRIDENGSLGIGTTSPFRSSVYGHLTISNTEPTLFLEDTNSSSYGVGRFIFTDGELKYLVGSRSGNSTTNSQEYMRIDSSGNLLVGGTETTLYDDTTGTQLCYRNGASLDIKREGTPLNVNRTVSDGALVTFFRSGTEVGGIGSRSGTSNIYIESSDSGRLRANGVDVAGWNSSNGSLFSASDNGNDLGTTGNRWKDIYLAGGLYVGGTGTANKLDDYEEGTWTATVNSATGFSTGVTANSGSKYTKIGNLVTVRASFTLGNSSGTVTVGDTITISGLPFTPATQDHVICNGYRYNTSNSAVIHVSTAQSNNLFCQITSVQGSPNRVNGSVSINFMYEV